MPQDLTKAPKYATKAGYWSKADDLNNSDVWCEPDGQGYEHVFNLTGKFWYSRRLMAWDLRGADRLEPTPPEPPPPGWGDW